MTAIVENTNRPVHTLILKVFAAEVEKWYLILCSRLHISNQGQSMRNGKLGGAVLIETTALKAPGPFYNPEVTAELAAIEIDAKLLRPEREKCRQAINAGIGRSSPTAVPAVMPAIDQAQRLRTPVPVAAWAYRVIHRALHLIEILYLLHERLIIYPTYMWIE